MTKRAQTSRSLGNRIALFVSIMIAAAALVPSLAATFLFLNALSVAQARTSAFQVMNYYGRMSVFTDYVQSIPASIARAYSSEILSVKYAGQLNSEKGTAGFSLILENQILQFDFIKQISILSSKLGGMELLKVGFDQGRPASFEAASLNTTSDIPFFLSTARTKVGAVNVSKPNVIRDDNDNDNDTIEIHVGLRVTNPEQVLERGGGDMVFISFHLNEYLKRQFITEDENSVAFLTTDTGEMIFSNHTGKRFEKLVGEAWEKFERGGALSDNGTRHVVVSQHVVGRIPFHFSEGGRTYYVGFATKVVDPLQANFDLILIVALLTIVMIVIGSIIGKKMTYPITRITDIAQQVATGETSTEFIEENASSKEAQLLTSALVTIRESLEKGKAKLRETNFRLHSATQAAGLGYFEISDNQDEYWSEELFELIGLTPEIKGNRDLRDYVAEKHKQEYDSCIDFVTTNGERSAVTLEILNENGELRWYSMIFVQLVSEEDGSSRIIVTVQDVDTVKRAETIKSEFISTVSHELRTPMTSILGGLKIASAQALGDIDERYVKILTIAKTNAERLLRLIDQILYLEKDVSSVTSIVPESFKLDQMLENVIGENSEFATKFDVNLVNDAESFGDLEICADIDRMNQVLTNLISNGVKFSGAGTTVKLTTTIEDGKIVFVVSDQGTGIPQEHLENIFKPFFQADSSVNRQVEGTGLGLTITKSIVDLHGGTINVTSSSEGTNFRVELPHEEQET